MSGVLYYMWAPRRMKGGDLRVKMTKCALCSLRCPYVFMRKVMNHKLILGISLVVVAPALRAKLACRHACAAEPGRRSARRTWMAAVSNATLPAWCAAARGTGTRYSSVEIPRATCTLAIKNNPVAARSASGGNVARAAARRLDAKSSAVAM